jgi:hypothetical protein
MRIGRLGGGRGQVLALASWLLVLITRRLAVGRHTQLLSCINRTRYKGRSYTGGNPSGDTAPTRPPGADFAADLEAKYGMPLEQIPGKRVRAAPRRAAARQVG